MGTMRWGRLAGAAALALILSGCAGDSGQPATPEPTGAPATPSASPTPDSSPAPTASPDPLTSVDGLVVRPTVLELRAGGAVIATLDYMSSAEEAVSTLTRALGAAPTDEPYEGSSHYPPGVLHRWDGLVLDERFYDEQQRTANGYDYLIWPRFAVTVEGAAAAGVPVSTSGGHQAGDPWDEVAADPGFDPDVLTCDGTPIEIQTISTPQGTTARATVAVARSDDGGSVRWLRAPSLEADGCA